MKCVVAWFKWNIRVFMKIIMWEDEDGGLFFRKRRVFSINFAGMGRLDGGWILVKLRVLLKNSMRGDFGVRIDFAKTRSNFWKVCWTSPICAVRAANWTPEISRQCGPIGCLRFRPGFIFGDMGSPRREA